MDSYDDKAIGQRLRIARKHAGFESPADAAAAFRLAYSTYAGHENGSRGIVRAAPTYARRFRVTLDWLLMGRGIAPDVDPSSPDSKMRLALLAYGVDTDDLDQVVGIIDTFAPGAKPEESPSAADSQPASRRRVKEPSR